jgi:dihydropteroate synthase
MSVTLSDLVADPARRRPLVMGVVNVTPDSFSDGGRTFDPDAAVEQALRLVAEGAEVLDIGGESTRPGADPVSEAEEIARTEPVIARLSRLTDRPLSIDTRRTGTARAAFTAGATIWNDVSALGDDGALTLAASSQRDVILMHMQGAPKTMQLAPSYEDVTAEVKAFLLARAAAAEAAGVAKTRIWLDPGIGFGKTLAHNVALIAALPSLCAHGYPVLLGASRKGFIAALDRSSPGPDARLGGSLAAALWGARSGCAMVRVHDVAETAQALTVWTAFEGAQA